MTDTTAIETPAWRLWTPEGFREDDLWVHAESVDLADETNAGIILPLAQFLALPHETRASLRGRLGVSLAPGEALDELVPFLPEIELVALAFPAFSDGRSFSKAELLRSRHGFAGAIRATGDVLIDQVPHMLRLGFDEFEVTNPTALKRLEEGRIGGLAEQYQPTTTSSPDASGYAWRRKALAG